MPRLADEAAGSQVEDLLLLDHERGAATPAADLLEIVLSTSRRLRVAPGFDGPTLQRLLALLEEGRP